MTTLEQHEAEWAAIRAAHFPTVTDPIELLRLHSSYMLGFQAGMLWMREQASRAILESVKEANP
jgi:hypothetical protein